MNLPKKIKLGFRHIEVRIDPELSCARNLLSTGHTGLGYVTILSSLEPELQAECLFRGIMESIFDLVGITHDRKDKHRISMGIFSVVRNNMDLLIPKTMSRIRILGQYWKVIEEPNHYDFAGRKVNDNNAIHLNATYDDTAKWHILWHEILHAIWDKLELLISEEEDERDAEAISFLLCTMFSENDFSWMAEDEG